MTAIILSCSRVNNNIIFVNTDSADYISLMPSDTIDNVGYRLFRVELADSLLLISNSSKDKQLCIYNLRNGKSVFRFNTGRGPGEMLSLYDLSVSSDRTVALVDVTMNSISLYSLDSLIEESFQGSSQTVIDLEGKTIINTVCFKGDELYGTGNVDGARIFKLNFDGTNTPIASYSPDTKNGGLDRFINEAYMGKITYDSSHDAFVIACLHADQIEVYDCKTGEVRFIKGPDNEEPRYKVVADYGGTLAHLQGEITAYRQVTTDLNYIYTFYTGRSKDYTEMRVFDWTGRMVKVFLLPVEASRFDIDEEGMLYVADSDTILVYNIKDYL